MSDLLNQASLVMVPSGYKEDTVYSVVPSDGSGDLSFTRASDGTRVNSAGLVEVVPWNLLQYSEDFTNAYWNKYQSTITSNSTTAPNGTTTADTLSSGSGFSGVLYTSAIFSAGDILTLSIYAKANTSSLLQLGTTDATDRSANFNLSTGVVVSSVGVTASIESVGNGWYRCSVSRTMVDSANFFAVEATGSLSLFIWGAQTNVGSTAKPYFPTTDRLNVPRLTYQNGGGGCPSLLLEKQSTNLVTYSEEFDNAAWTSASATVSANSTTSPDGTQNADLIYPSISGSNLGLYQNTTGVTGVVGTVSCYVKSAGKNWALLGTDNTSSKNVSFDLVNGVVGSVATGYTATIENVGNGWYRITTTFQSGYSLSYPFVGVADNTNRSVTASGTNGIYIWGFQIEISSYPTSYIPTTSSSATRVADVCSKTGISSLIGSSEGTLFIDINITKLTDNEAIGTINSGGYTNNTTFQRIGNTIQFVRNSATQSGASVETQTIAIGRHKMAIAYKSGNTAFYLDGSQVSTTQTQTFTNGTLSVLNLGTDAIGALPITESYNQAIIFPTRLTNAELASLTTI